MRQELVHLRVAVLERIGQCRHQPLLRQGYLRCAALFEGFGVFLAVNQGHGRVQADQRYAALLQCQQAFGGVGRGLFKGPEKALHLQRFAVGREGREVNLITQPGN